MDPLQLLPRRWRSRAGAARHAAAIAGVLDTAPIVPRRDGLVLFSMIGTAVLLPYLVAVKSLWRELGRGRVAILDDGTLTAQDRAVLAQHCGDPELIAIASVDTAGFPKGGCWERLLTILDRRGGEYWLQLDSDTVTLGPQPEVLAAIAGNRSFTLLGGADAGEEPLPLDAFASAFYPQGPAEGHIQARIESRLGALARPQWRYIRGCAGFTGFAAGGAGREMAAAFHGALSELLGAEAMGQWGTEQVASNFIVASEPRSVMLPYARYLNYWAQGWPADAALVHFVGTHRHDNGAYIEASRRAIERISAAPAAR